MISSVSPVPEDVANVCPARVLPLSEVSPPPAPASVPHENDPLVQRSLSPLFAHEDSPAPKSPDDTYRFEVVIPPVEEALPRYVCPDTERAVVEARPKEEIEDERLVENRLVAVALPRLATVE